MKVKHAYKPSIRALVRTLVSCGCSEGKVGELVKEVAGIFGVTIDKVLTRRTVRRIVLEGLVMARAQLGHEMKLTEDITMSGDGTSRRNINYQAHHATYRVLEVLADGSVRLADKATTRFLGIRSTVDHSTEKSKESWVRVLQEISSIYNDSPLAKRTASAAFDLRAICRKLRGMSSDHANGEKATAEAMGELKREETMMGLGEDRKASMDVAEFESLMREWNGKKMDDAGGFAAYMALSPERRAVLDIATVNAMMKSLGEEQFQTLPKEEQRLLTLFVWSGCCMHKDQNSFKGGNTAMMAAWQALGLQGPITLANKANANILKKVVAPEMGGKEATEAEVAALEASTCGGAKTAALAGAIFNHRSDKKGQGDTHTIILSHKLDTLIRRFPQVNNTRFGSHGEAAGELLVHLEEYREFLRHIKTKKVSDSWTNIELNVYNALHDDPTLTELAAMALYQQLITHPYMRMVRVPEEAAKNALSLGPMHAELREHIQKLIESPDLVLDFATDSYVTAAFDAKPYERPEVVQAIEKLVAEGHLKHLKEIFVSFLKGANVTWLRFSSEYAPGGLIDGLTDEEKARAFMNATNDRNEGALGSWCVYTRNNPSSTMTTHNALAMFSRNHTQQFVNAFFGADDHVWAMRKAREIDAAGWEKARRREQAEFELRMVEMKRVKIAKRKEQADQRRHELDSTPLIPDLEVIPGLTIKKLDIQLDKLRLLWGSNIVIPKKSHIKKSQEKKDALKDAFRTHQRLLLEKGCLPEVPRDTTFDSDTLEVTVEAWHAEDDEEMDESD
ncbi:hypothetical protein BDZ89DRAFT_1029665 [Hymenopellis radicata]|nr:hypothetical protein BDZ89DRAFT_1029665 [Hymenopellis radicata]